MENYDSAIDELVISAENTLNNTDCVTPAFLCKDKKGKERVEFWWITTFQKLKELWYQILQVFIPDI